MISSVSSPSVFSFLSGGGAIGEHLPVDVVLSAAAELGVRCSAQRRDSSPSPHAPSRAIKRPGVSASTLLSCWTPGSWSGSRVRGQDPGHSRTKSPTAADNAPVSAGQSRRLACTTMRRGGLRDARGRHRAQRHHSPPCLPARRNPTGTRPPDQTRSPKAVAESAKTASEWTTAAPSMWTNTIRP